METQNLETPAVLRNARTGRNIQLVSERPAQTPDAALAARAAALEAKEASLATALATVTAAFSILGSRALVILAALAAAGAFGWAIAEPSAWRVAGAGLWTAMVFWPALWIDRRGG